MEEARILQYFRYPLVCNSALRVNRGGNVDPDFATSAFIFAEVQFLFLPLRLFLAISHLTTSSPIIIPLAIAVSFLPPSMLQIEPLSKNFAMMPRRSI